MVECSFEARHDSDPQLSLRQRLEVLLSRLPANPVACAVHAPPVPVEPTELPLQTARACTIQPVVREKQVLVGFLGLANPDGLAPPGFTFCAVCASSQDADAHGEDKGMLNTVSPNRAASLRYGMPNAHSQGDWHPALRP